MDGAAPKLVVPDGQATWASDPTFYPVEDKVGQDSLHVLICELLRPLVERWYGLLGKPTFVGADQFIYYKQFHPNCVVAPDVYVLPGVSPGTRVISWKVWEKLIVPSFALEVVSSNDFEKDYRESVERYSELGVPEVVIFDPNHHLDKERVRWQRYRKLKSRGFVRVEMSNGDRVKSHVLGCFLREVGEGDGLRLRLGSGRTGETLVPTSEEYERSAKEAALSAKEAALSAKEAALSAKETERAAKEVALARVAELEALLAKKSYKKR